MIKYSDKTKDHFFNPRNCGVMDNPTAAGKAVNPSCGDTLELFLKIEEDIISKAMFRSFGCGAAIAAGSIFTEMLTGKTLNEALRIKNAQISEALGGLPEEKIQCSVLAEAALKDALKDIAK